MAVKDNKGQAKVKARGTHSKSSIAKKRTKRSKPKLQHQHHHQAGPPAAASSATLGDGALRVLLLGEGNFAFAAALALHLMPSTMLQ